MDLPVSRQQFLCGLGVGGAAVALTACTTYSEQPEQTTTETSADQPDAAQAALATTAQIPVGSGIVVDEIVLTQPVAGEYKGFSNVCTHSGCRINAVTDGLIACPCHGSRFKLDGTVAQGPASRPLDTKPIVVEGGSIFAG